MLRASSLNLAESCSRTLVVYEIPAHIITVNDAPAVDAGLYFRKRIFHFAHETLLNAFFYVFMSYARLCLCVCLGRLVAVNFIFTPKSNGILIKCTQSKEKRKH